MEMKDIFKEHADAVEARLEELGLDTRELKARLADLEQKSARPSGGNNGLTPSMGQQFIENTEVKGFIGNASAGRRIGVETKATITSATTDAAGSVGDAYAPQRDMILPSAQRMLTIRDLLPVVPVSTGSVEYPRVKSVTNSADTVAEGATKPQSDLQIDLVTVPIRTIAHWMLASRQILDDAPQLRGTIDTELMYGLKYVEEDQLLNGGGTGTDLNGIVTQATAFAAGTNTAASPNKIDVILYAILQGALNNLPPTGIVLHPSDWTSMRGIKDTAGAYILGAPASTVEPRLFGLPVVPSQAMAAGSFLTGDFATSATLYDRWQARVEISTEDSDNFRKNLVTLLCEERIGLAVKRPLGFIKGTFSAAITDLTS